MARIIATVRFNKFGKSAAQGKAAQQAMLKEVRDLIVKTAQGNAKVDTGYMRDNTVATAEGVAARARYSGFLDRGTRYIAADHWFTNAVDQGYLHFNYVSERVLRPAYEFV
jgi:hypothetical protein